MAETELDSMVVKLKGDATSYQKMINDAGKGISTLGKTANSAWSVTEKSFIQAIRSVDAMMSRTVASITNGMEGIVRVSIDAGSRIISAWAGVFTKLTGPVGAMLANVAGVVYGSVKSLVVGVDKLLAGIPSAIATTLGATSGVVGTVLAGAFGIAGAAMVAFGGEMTRVFRETMDLNKAAKNLGVTILDLRAGVLWSGVAMSTFTNILGNVQTKITELKAGTIATQREFRNFSALANRSVDDIAKGGWETIIDALGAIPDASQRASVAFSILGNEADKILGAIERGGVGEAKSLAKRLGLDVDPASMQSLKQIAQFTREVEALKTGLVNQVMLGLAPIAAELSSTFNLSKTDITWIKDTVTDVALEIGRWGSMIMAVFSDTSIMKSFFDYIRHSFDDIMHSFEVSLLRTIAKIARAVPLLGSSVAESLEKEAKRTEIHRKVPQGRADFAWRSALQNIGDSPIMQAFNEYEKRVRDRQKQPPDAVDKNKTPPIAIEKLNQSFDQLINSLKQPIDAWKQSLVDLKRLTDAGKFQGLGNQQAMVAAQMFRQLKEGTGMAGNPMFAGGATAGSTEAYSAIAQFNAMRDRGDTQKQIETALIVANRQREAQIAQGEAVIRALNNMGENILQMADNEVDL